jgi:hypothetical protein
MPFSRKILLLSSLLSLGIFITDTLSLWGNASFLFVVGLYNFIDAFGKRIIYKDLLALLVIAKMFFAPSYFYGMTAQGQSYITTAHILPYEYFAFAAPATALFVIGLLLPVRFGKAVYPKEERAWLNQCMTGQEQYKEDGYNLIKLGLLGTLLSQVLSSTPFDFVLYNLENLLLIGALYLTFYGSDKIGLLYIGITTVLGFATGMLGAFIWPIIFYSSYYFLSRQTPLSLPTKLGLAAIAVVVLSVLQVVKHDYRQLVWFSSQYSGLSEKLTLYTDLIIDHVQHSDAIVSEESMMPVMQRLDQGMLVHWSMKYVPAVEPYAGGETIFQAFLASLVPRLLWPDKPEAGGREKMKRFTGRTLSRGVSMNIGIFGEAYVNFSVLGGIVFLFFWGIAVSYIFHLFSSYALQNPAILLWIPLFWSRGINAIGTDFVSSFNTLFKVGFIVVGVLFLLNKLRSSSFRVKPQELMEPKL